MLAEKPLLLIDVDGVISLFDWNRVRGPRVLVDGIPHHLSAAAGAALRDLTPSFEMVWCTGWEERAEEHLPRELELEGGWPHLHFDRAQGPGHTTHGHWKLAAIDAFAGPHRPVAWIDDAHDEACERWVVARPGPTLLVTTDPALGLDATHARVLLAWAEGLRG